MLPRHAGLDVEVHVVGVAIAGRVGRHVADRAPDGPGSDTDGWAWARGAAATRRTRIVCAMALIATHHTFRMGIGDTELGTRGAGKSPTLRRGGSLQSERPVRVLEAQALAVTDDLIQPARDDLRTVFLALPD